jgi:hypothetical protein
MSRVTPDPVRVSIFETRGGALINEIDPASLSWDAVTNEAETVKVNIDLNSASESGRNWRSLAAPWKHSIAVETGGRVYGGPILPHDFDDDSATLNVTARGGRILWASRSVLPVAAIPPRSLLLGNGLPDTSLDTNLVGFDLGTIGKKLIEQACEWPGWDDIPIVFPADRPGAHERNYPAIERKNLDDALSDLSGVDNGPDFRLQLEKVGNDAFQWRFDSGTEAQPRLESPDVFAWEVGQGSGLSVSSNPSRMGSLAWSEGGRSNDTALVRSLYNPTLIDFGFPLLELESDASSNTVLAETLDAWNMETLRTSSRPWEFWSFKIRADEPPFLSEYNVGDQIDVVITKDSPIAGGYIGPGTYRRRIAKLSGDMSEWITVTCGEAFDG